MKRVDGRLLFRMRYAINDVMKWSTGDDTVSEMLTDVAWDVLKGNNPSLYQYLYEEVDGETEIGIAGNDFVVTLSEPEEALAARRKDEPPTPRELLEEAVKITEVIVTHGGMATKTAVEDVLMNRFDSLNRCEAHDVMNAVEFLNLKPPDRRFNDEPAPTLEQYAPFLAGVDIRWYRGNPFALQGVQK